VCAVRTDHVDQPQDELARDRAHERKGRAGQAREDEHQAEAGYAHGKNDFLSVI
jgi:hypothetical protein